MPKTTQIAMQRAASLMLLVPLLAELGTSMDAALDGTGVTPDQLQPDAFIPYVAFLAILDNARRLTGREDIALRLGQRQTLAALGPLGLVMRHAATLGEALADFTAFQIHNSTGGAVYLMRADRDVILGYGVYGLAEHVSPLIHDLVLAVGCNLIAELTKGAVGPEELLIARAVPADPAPYEQLVRCPARFGQIQTGLLLRASALDFALPESDAARHDKALAKAVAALEGALPDMTGRVRHILRPLMLLGKGGMADVAARLDLHPRALRRRLRDEGATFEAIKDDVRQTAARELLLLGALSITDIALTLDYATASAFVHAFRRWSGISPGRWRDAQSNGQVASGLRPDRSRPPHSLGRLVGKTGCFHGKA